MAITDIKYTVLQVVNEVQRKLGLAETSLSANKLSVQLVDHINDVMAELSDFGNWQEAWVSANITVVSGQNDYSINTSAVVKNIGDLYISTRRGPLRNVDTDTMRIMTRTTAVGTPSQYCIIGTDSNGNPNIRVRPTPSQYDNGSLFSINYWIKPPIYTTASSSVLIPFPSRVVVLGVLTRYLLNESSGAPSSMYQAYYQEYIEARREALNRFNFDTNYNISFTPGNSRGRGRW